MNLQHVYRVAYRVHSFTLVNEFGWSRFPATLGAAVSDAGGYGPGIQKNLVSAPRPGSDPARYKRQQAAVEYLTDHYHEAPVWIVACLEDGENPGRTAGSSIYGAVQNMCLATRALGLGTTLTTRHTGYGKEVDAIFGLPPGAHSYAILPIGWPMGNFGKLGRGPLKDVVYGDRWGQPYKGL